MPLYSDLGMYYSPHITTPSYYSSPFLGSSSRSSGSLGLGLLPVPRLLPSRVTPGYSALPSIPESGYSAVRRALPSLDRTAAPRVPTPRYLPPKPVHIDTSDIDVSAARFTAQRRDRPQPLAAAAGGEPGRQATIKRGRTVVRLHTKKLKENPTLDTPRQRLTPGEKLVQKFLILDKAEEAERAARRKRIEEMEERERVAAEIAKLQAMAAKKAAAAEDPDAPPIPSDGTFAQEPGTVPPVQNFPTIQGLTENAALDILLSAAEDNDDEEAQGGEIARTGSTGTVKKRKIKGKEGTVKAAKKKTKKKDALANSTPEDSPATGDEMGIEKSTLQRRNTVRFRRNSQDLEGFPEIESVPGSRRTSFDMSPNSRRSSFDQSPSSRRSSIESTGDETPMASEKKSTVKRKKGPKHKIIADVSVDNSPTTEPRSPKFVVDEVKVEQSPASPRGVPKKFRYEVIVEDVEAETAAGRRGKSDKENKSVTVVKKKKPKATAGKPLADQQGKSVSKSGKDQEEATGVKAEEKEMTQKSFQKSRPVPAEETKTREAASKTEENEGKIAKKINKEKTTQDIMPKSTVQKNEDVVDKILKPIGNEVQDSKIVKEKGKHIISKDRKMSSEIPKLDAKDIQKGIFAVGKPKPPTLASVVTKVEDATVGKHVAERTKTTKHQPDPSPPPTPTIQKSDSGINFWAFLNGSDEEKELKKPILPEEEPLIQPGADKHEKTKGVKAKPNLHLNLQNKFAPAEKILETEDAVSQPTLLEKINEKGTAKTNEEKKGKLLRKPGDIAKDSSDSFQGAKTFGGKKEPQTAPPKLSSVQDSFISTPEVTKNILSKPKRDLNTTEEPQNVSLVAKTPDEKVPKWKALAKDRTKTREESPNTAGVAGKFGFEEKISSEPDLPSLDKKLGKSATKEVTLEHDSNAAQPSETTVLKPDEDKTKALVEEPTVALPKVSETPEKKPVPKWKGFGKQPQSTPSSPKDAPCTSKTPATPESKNTDVKLKSQISQTFPKTSKTSDESPLIPSPTRNAKSGLGHSPAATDGARDTPKTLEENEQAKSPLSSERKERAVGDEPLEKNLLKSQGSKQGKPTCKVTTPEEESKPVPKWKVKAQVDKDGQPKKTPLGKIKQSSSDNSLVSNIATASLEDLKATSSSEPATPLQESILTDTVKTSTTGKNEEKLQKTEFKTPNDTEKPPKKPLSKTKVAAKLESRTKESEVSCQLNIDQKKSVSPSATSDVTVTTKEMNEAQKKKEDIEKTKDTISLGKLKLTETKSKEEEKDIRTPFGKKIKVSEQKSLDKKDEEKTTSVANKGIKLTAQKSQDDVKNKISAEIKIEQKSDDVNEKKGEPKSPVKKAAKLIGQKSKDEEKSEPLSPLKKAPKQSAPKKEEETTTLKKSEMLTTQKSEDTDDGKKEPTSAGKKGPKLAVKKNKDEDESEPPSPVKKEAKLITQKSKEEDTAAPSSPVKKTGKLAAQKSKEDSGEPSSPVQKAPKLAAQKIKDKEKPEPVSPVRKGAQKSKGSKETVTPTKKGARLMAQKSKEDPSQDSTDAPKTATAGKAKPQSGKTKAAAPTLPTPPLPASESGSDADSEESSSSSSSEDEDGDTTPHASAGSSSSGSSCSSSDSGFDSRPSSVPGSPPSNKKVPSTASEASSSPSPSLASSQLLDPYSEDAGLLPRTATGRSTPPACSLPRFRKYTVDDFQFLKLLGKGSFGKVMLAELRGTDRYYAVKCLKKDVVLEDDDVECTLIERKVLSLGSKHPYLCHLFCTFQTESHLLFVMEYLNGGDLMFHIQQSGRFPEPRARFYAAEIVSGLKFLHKKGIVYRDLKLDNILLDYEGHVRIADFGMCKLQIFLDRTADTFCGTPDYMAPEIIKGLKYNQCVDWWSFGVLVFEMLVGVSPFTGCDEDELFWSICNEQPQYPRFLSREAHSLLTSLLEKDASKRLGTQDSPKGDVPDHVFFRSVDWGELERRELEPPFRPRVKHPLDVQYFDKAFTAERAELTPVDASILQSMDQAQFQGFSYTNPNTTD